MRPLPLRSRSSGAAGGGGGMMAALEYGYVSDDVENILVGDRRHLENMAASV